MPRKKTNEEYINEITAINPKIDVLEAYINSYTKILHKCKVCGYEWLVKPDSIIKGRGCPQCAKLAKRKTHEQYVIDLQTINPNIEAIEKYVDWDTKILHRCKIDGYTWKTRPSIIIGDRKGCPRCGGKMKKTHDEYVKELAIVRPHISVVGTYINCSTPILHRCVLDGCEWMESPNQILHGARCPQCNHPLQKTHEQYVSELTQINPNVEVLEEYAGSLTHILHRCKICNHEWSPIPNSLLSGTECPKCGRRGLSSGEKEIHQYLDSRHINHVMQYKFDDCKDKNELPFDFYLPDYNSCIEYDGKQHFEPVDLFGGIDEFIVRKKHDEIKDLYCNKNGIRLCRISYRDDIIEILDHFFTKQND